MDITMKQKILVKKLLEILADIEKEMLNDEAFKEYIDNLYSFEFIEKDMNKTLITITNLYRKNK